MRRKPFKAPSMHTARPMAHPQRELLRIFGGADKNVCATRTKNSFSYAGLLPGRNQLSCMRVDNCMKEGQECSDGGSLSSGKEGLTISRRRLPHWRLEGSTYFITFRLKKGTLNTLERRLVRDQIVSGNEKYYLLLAAVVMPDHVHILLRPKLGIALSRIMKGIKGGSSRLLNGTRQTRGSLWQDECWDRIVRDEAEFCEKLEYMFNNPMKRGVCQNTWEYEGWYFNSEESADKNVRATKDTTSP